MAASMLTGERRWMSARRGGMTVLGKVTVPKPVNLPSQRLENHGLDPNVEIVPKGTLSWGSRSSSAQNAWGSAPLSPSNTDGGAGSPSRLNDRPSSGGSGIRPSTAGSERSHERPVNVWGPSSRPSSASGVLASNQTSIAAARPRSAETRPGSSNLSRFAEPLSDNSVAWAASGTLEKLGVSSSKTDFSLSSGDFPTLGSDKSAETHMRQGHSSQGRPLSASGRAHTPKERSVTSPAANDTIDSSKEESAILKKNGPPDFGVGVRPSTDKWQRDPQLCPDPNMPPQYFGPWRGAAPHNSPNGVWYGGPSGGLPCGPPGPPGSYPIEPFYYHHRLPARPIANMQPLPRPGPGPGYHPNNGDSYRPRMPDSYAQPVMPVSSAIYPVQIPYDGYYGPPRAAFCSPGERDAPIMGMHSASGVYNRYPIQNIHPDPNFHGPGGHDPKSTPPAMELGGAGPPHGNHQGPYRVLLKQHDGWDDIDGNEHTVNTHLGKGNMPGTPRREQTVNTQLGKGNQSGPLTRESDPENRKNDELVSFTRTMSRGEASVSADMHGHSSASVGSSFPESVSKPQKLDENFVKETQTAFVSGDTSQQVMPTKRNPTLIEKIESLNNKARICDGRDGGPAKDEKVKTFRVLSPRSHHAPSDAQNAVTIPAMEVTVSAGDKSLEVNASSRVKSLDKLSSEGAVVSRPVRESHASAAGVLGSCGGYMNKRSHGVLGRADHRGKGRVNPQDAEEWRKKPLVADVTGVIPLKQSEMISNDDALNIHSAQEPSEKSNLSAFDPNDQKVQRAKMREIAAERARQRQKEEEERSREQAARAFAKLEALNKRTQAKTSTEKVEHMLPQSGVSQLKQEDTLLDPSPVADANSNSEVSISASGWESDTSPPQKVPGGHRESKEGTVEAPLSAPRDPVITHNLSPPLSQAVDTTGVSDLKTAQYVNSSAPKSKQVGYKKRQNINKNPSEKSIAIGSAGDTTSQANANLNASGGESNLSRDNNVTDERMLQHKRRNNRGGKNKHKLDEVSSGPSLPSSAAVAEISTSASFENNKRETTESALTASLKQAPALTENADGQDNDTLFPSKDKGISPTEALSGVNNQSKPQVSRRLPRNTQTSRAKEKLHGSDVVWAPVRPLNKNEASADASYDPSTEAHVPATVHSTHNNQKKRAEMERYVPKRVAEELSQQGHAQQPSSPPVQSVSSEMTVGAETSKYVAKPVAKELSLQGSTLELPSSSGEKTRRTESSLVNESSNLDGSDGGKGGSASVKPGDGKNFKHGRTHGLWRQRNSSKSAQASLEGSSDKLIATSKSIEHHQTHKSEMYLPDPDNSNGANNSISTVPVSDSHAMKDRGVGGRGKKQPYKGHKGTGQNLDHKDWQGRGAIEVIPESSSLDMNQLDRKIASGENNVERHASSHWQPKSQNYGGQNRQGSWGNGGQRVTTQVGNISKPEYHSQEGWSTVGESKILSNKDNSSSVVQSRSDETDSQKTVVTGVPNRHHQDVKRERRIESSKEGAHFSDEHPDKPPKLYPPKNVNNLSEQSCSGAHRDGYHNGRFGRGHETHRGCNSARQDGRWKNESHHEYQPARSYSNKANESLEEGSHATGSKYRERGHTQSRRGGENFYGREQ